MNIRPYANKLRANGFRKDWESRAGGVRVVIFKKNAGRLLDGREHSELPA